MNPGNESRRTAAPKVLIFDIGGTVFDWRTAVLERLALLAAARPGLVLDNEAFALACRARFMEMNGDVIAGRRAWMTADAIYAGAVAELCGEFKISDLTQPERDWLTGAWCAMPAWPDAPAAIARLRQHFVVAPLTILSWSMAVGSSRRNGIAWDGLLSCDLLGVYKPDPRCFARATEILRVRPAEIMMVASHPSDLRAGQAAGYRAAYVRARLEDPGEDYTDTGFEREFEIVASDFGDLARRLTALTEKTATISAIDGPPPSWRNQ